MSNFAERLVARSAGAPPTPGMSMLTPRPVSRFEPVAAGDIEMLADESPRVAGPVAAETELQAHPTDVPMLIERDEPSRPAREQPTASSLLPEDRIWTLRP